MKDNVILICDVSLSYFSVARHYGGATIEGKQYRYFQERDILVRNDWVRYYRRLPWDDFLNAVKTGIKPQLSIKKEAVQSLKDNMAEISSLFD